ncbi:MAG: methylglyoxal synthase [Clostridiales bacterium]|jgi:methylglyoxal synthase|nr:methylglyoxal synthase [Clostridiales bacterium]
MNIALIAHDNKKNGLIAFIKEYHEDFSGHTLFATGTTGKKIKDETGFDVFRFNSGPYGGDQQIGAKVSQGEINLVIFFRDPLTSQPHEPDVNALLRLCDVFSVPLATNVRSAAIMMEAVKNGLFDELRF